MDGARLWNASVASGIALSEFADCADTVMVAFSKGLGAPIGAALAGSHRVIEKAWTARKLFGGAMRQSGIVAAGALYALDHHIERLEEDHDNARTLARLLESADGVSVVPPDTNIVMLDLPPGRTANAIARAAAEDGVLVSEWAPARVRLVTHLDVTVEDITVAGAVLTRLLRAHALA